MFLDLTPNLPTHGFLLMHGRFATIDFPGALATLAFGINPQGEVVGPYTDSSGNGHGFLLSNGTFATIDVPRAIVTVAGSITRKATSWGSILTAAATLMVFC